MSGYGQTPSHAECIDRMEWLIQKLFFNYTQEGPPRGPYSTTEACIAVRGDIREGRFRDHAWTNGVYSEYEILEEWLGHEDLDRRLDSILREVCELEGVALFPGPRSRTSRAAFPDYEPPAEFLPSPEEAEREEERLRRAAQGPDVPESRKWWYMGLGGYQQEFPGFELDVPIPEGFVDNSYQNNMSPSFLNEELGLTLWIGDAGPDPWYRFPGWPRFLLEPMEPDPNYPGQLQPASDHEQDNLQTDDWQLVLDTIEEVRRGTPPMEAVEMAKRGEIRGSYKKAWQFIGLGQHPPTSLDIANAKDDATQWLYDYYDAVVEDVEDEHGMSVDDEFVCAEVHRRVRQEIWELDEDDVYRRSFELLFDSLGSHKYSDFLRDSINAMCDEPVVEDTPTPQRQHGSRPLRVPADFQHVETQIGRKGQPIEVYRHRALGVTLETDPASGLYMLQIPGEGGRVTSSYDQLLEWLYDMKREAGVQLYGLGQAPFSMENETELLRMEILALGEAAYGWFHELQDTGPEEAVVAFEASLYTARDAGRELMDAHLDEARQLLLQGRQQLRAGMRLSGMVPDAAIEEHEADDLKIFDPVLAR